MKPFGTVLTFAAAASAVCLTATVGAQMGGGQMRGGVARVVEYRWGWRCGK